MKEPVATTAQGMKITRDRQQHRYHGVERGTGRRVSAGTVRGILRATRWSALDLSWADHGWLAGAIVEETLRWKGTGRRCDRLLAAGDRLGALWLLQDRCREGYGLDGHCVVDSNTALCGMVEDACSGRLGIS